MKFLVDAQLPLRLATPIPLDNYLVEKRSFVDLPSFIFGILMAGWE